MMETANKSHFKKKKKIDLPDCRVCIQQSNFLDNLDFGFRFFLLFLLKDTFN